MLLLFIWIIVASMILSILHKSFLCIVVKWLLSYIQSIDWFVTCLDLYAVSLHLNFFSEYVIGLFTKKVITLYHCKRIIIFFPVHWLLLNLLRSVCCFVAFELLKAVCHWLFYKKWLLCMIVKWLLSYIQLIDWFFTYLGLFVVFICELL